MDAKVSNAHFDNLGDNFAAALLIGDSGLGRVAGPHEGADTARQGIAKRRRELEVAVLLATMLVMELDAAGAGGRVAGVGLYDHAVEVVVESFVLGLRQYCQSRILICRQVFSIAFPP